MKGFTLIELIVAVAISLTVTGLILVNYNTYNDTQTLKQAALTLKNNLRYAQIQALTGKKPTPCTELLGYIVNFFNVPNNPSNYTIQAECNTGPQGATTVVNLPGGVTFSPQPGGLRFNVLSRGTTLNSDLIIHLAGSGKQYWVQVNRNGDIDNLGIH
jgi:prepilin-type N-terminal cleavage/methylation domain-containing protein